MTAWKSENILKTVMASEPGLSRNECEFGGGDGEKMSYKIGKRSLGYIAEGFM